MEDHRKSTIPINQTTKHNSSVMRYVSVISYHTVIVLLNKLSGIEVWKYMKTSTSSFLCPFNIRITSLVASSGVLGGGLASFQPSINFLYLQIQNNISKH